MQRKVEEVAGSGPATVVTEMELEEEAGAVADIVPFPSTTLRHRQQQQANNNTGKTSINTSRIVSVSKTRWKI